MRLSVHIHTYIHTWLGFSRDDPPFIDSRLHTPLNQVSTYQTTWGGAISIAMSPDVPEDAIHAGNKLRGELGRSFDGDSPFVSVCYVPTKSSALSKTTNCPLRTRSAAKLGRQFRGPEW